MRTPRKGPLILPVPLQKGLYFAIFHFPNFYNTLKMKSKGNSMLVFLLWSSLAIAKPAKDILNCNKRDLALRTCTLKQGPLRVELQKERLRLNDGVWRNLEDEPLKGDIEWHKVRLHNVGKKTVLEFWMWTTPKGEVAVSDLVWVVWEVNGVEVVERVHQVVQKRTPKVDGKGYILDKIKKHRLEPGPRGGVRWFVEDLHGEF